MGAKLTDELIFGGLDSAPGTRDGLGDLVRCVGGNSYAERGSLMGGASDETVDVAFFQHDVVAIRLPHGWDG
jgi:hypothetical protein